VAMRPRDGLLLLTLASQRCILTLASPAVPSIASPEDLKAFALAAGAKYQDTFRAAVREQMQRGIFKSGVRGARPQEMLLLAAVTAELNADVLVETGRARGDSALMLLSMLQRVRKTRGQPPIEFHSVDWTSARWHIPADNKVALSRLNLFPNVTLHDGDASLVLPELLPTLRGKRTVLFTDGPKGYAGLALQRQAIKMPHVIAQFIHDASYGYDVRAGLENLLTGKTGDMNRGAWPCTSEAFYSDDPDWQRANGHLDWELGVDPKALSHKHKQPPPCCMYRAPAPCYGEGVNVTEAIGLIMRRDDARSCLESKESLPEPQCCQPHCSPECLAWAASCQPKAFPRKPRKLAS
jgi:hypothetical protein